MNYIAAAILLCMNPQNDGELIESIYYNLDQFQIYDPDNNYEENCFWIFVHIM